MKVAQSIKVGFWTLILLNLLITAGAIWLFLRMDPAIEDILQDKQQVLIAGENMLGILALPEKKVIDIQRFYRNLSLADSSVQSRSDSLYVQTIRNSAREALAGDPVAIQTTITTIHTLGKTVREAMSIAQTQAIQFGNSGAWVIAFMAVFIFTVGMLFIRTLDIGLIGAFEEIYSVIQARRWGDLMRRCTTTNTPRDIRIVLSALNEYLDTENRSDSIL